MVSVTVERTVTVTGRTVSPIGMHEQNTNANW